MFWRKYRDYLSSIFFIAISLFMIYLARMLPKSKVMSIGPVFMPTVIGVTTLILAVLLLILTVIRTKERQAALAKAEPEDFDYRRMLYSLVLILIYVFIMQPVGFILSTIIYLIPQFLVLAPDEERNKKEAIKLVVISIIFTIIVFLLFRYGFKIVLPAGLFTIKL